MSRDSSLDTITVGWSPPQSKGSTISSYTIRVYEHPKSMETINTPPVRVQVVDENKVDEHKIDMGEAEASEFLFLILDDYFFL
jgi:hypothetical protein